jgi:hypothetical protein
VLQSEKHEVEQSGALEQFCLLHSTPPIGEWKWSGADERDESEWSTLARSGAPRTVGGLLAPRWEHRRYRATAWTTSTRVGGGYDQGR